MKKDGEINGYIKLEKCLAEKCLVYAYYSVFVLMCFLVMFGRYLLICILLVIAIANNIGVFYSVFVTLKSKKNNKKYNKYGEFFAA